MHKNQKVILRFTNGKMLKGFVHDFKIASDVLYLVDESDQQHKVRLKELKAIFFVKKFEGERGQQEKRAAAGPPASSRRVEVRFKDGESITGSLDGDLPLVGASAGPVARAFTVIPDDESNNTKIIVVATAVQEVSVLVA